LLKEKEVIRMKKQEIFELVVRYTREVLPELEDCEIVPENSLTDLGFNSIDRAEVLTLVMEELALRIPRIELSGLRTIGDLVDGLYAKVQAL
jgi:polyketide biosynthesis acyl carrier protein